MSELIKGGSPMSNSLVFSTDRNRALLSRKHKDGTLIRLHSGIYSTDLTTDPQAQIRENIDEIIKSLGWEGRLAWRSALPGQEGQGNVLLVGPRGRSIEIGGVPILMSTANRITESCQTQNWRGGIHRPTLFAALLENMSTRKNETDRVDESGAHTHLAAWMRRRASSEGAQRAAVEARRLMRVEVEISGRAEEAQRLDRVIEEWRQVHANDDLYDFDLLGRVEMAAKKLAGMDIQNVKAPKMTESGIAARRFFEAYFTNYIEGSRLELEEAYPLMGPDGLGRGNARTDYTILTHKDEHDVAGMIDILKDPSLSRLAGHGGVDQWIQTILDVHSRMFVHRRDEVMAGQFKDKANRAGTTSFTPPEQVEGSLRKIHELLSTTPDGLGRATLMHNAFVSVHPFNDGNGRTTRLLLNSCMEEAGETRIVVPQWWRESYINGLEAWSWHGDIEASVRVFENLRQVGLDLFQDQDLKTTGNELLKMGAMSSPQERKWGLDNNPQISTDNDGTKTAVKMRGP